MYRKHRTSYGPSSLAKLWGFNLFLALSLFGTYFGVPFFKSSVLEYQNIASDPFDGTIMPIAYVPNWIDAKNWNKSLRFEDIPLDSYLETPRYDAELLKIDDPKNRLAILERGTYITPYMGSYRMNFEEYDGSHLGIDIRAPLGTPVLSIANGVVVRTNDRDTGDGKYAIIRHDSVPTVSGVMTVYSTYLHLESVSVQPWTKIRKWQPIGKVGMTGITTTPHLHFQIDKDIAPFHSYWPYTFSDAREIGIGFFEAVNVGLGKENALKYTIHPMEFVQANLSGPSVAAVPVAKTVSLAASSPEEDNPNTPKNSAPAEGNPISLNTVTPSIAPPPMSPDEIPWSAESISKIQTTNVKAPQTLDYSLNPTIPMTRAQAVIELAQHFGIVPAESIELPFSDVLPSDPVAGVLTRFVEAGYVTPIAKFRPNAIVTRAEIAILLVRISGISPLQGTSFFRDVKPNDTRLSILNAFAKSVGLKRGTKLLPEAPVTGNDLTKTLSVWKAKTGKS